tara:strand:+ start:66 stop:209 length:144 start_codon:yes stop_codon:yes gene_type:complete
VEVVAVLAEQVQEVMVVRLVVVELVKVDQELYVEEQEIHLLPIQFKG